MVSRDRIRDLVPAMPRRAQVALSAGEPMEGDEMLHRLLREAMSHGHQQRRHQAMLLLAASPYRPGLATELVHLTSSSEDDLAPYAAGTLRRLAGPDQATALLFKATSGAAAEVRSHALRAFGDLGPTAQARAGTKNAGALVAAVAREDAEPQVRRAATYALGMTGTLTPGSHETGHAGAAGEPRQSWDASGRTTAAC